MTTREIAIDEELCIRYLDVDMSFKERSDILKSWGSDVGPDNSFICHCKRCEFSRNEPTLTVIENLVDQVLKKEYC